MRKRVYIAYTGGTIGMQRTRAGYRPQPGYLQKQMAQMPELRNPSMPGFTIHEYTPLFAFWAKPTVMLITPRARIRLIILKLLKVCKSILH